VAGWTLHLVRLWQPLCTFKLCITHSLCRLFTCSYLPFSPTCPPPACLPRAAHRPPPCRPCHAFTCLQSRVLPHCTLLCHALPHRAPPCRAVAHLAHNDCIMNNVHTYVLRELLHRSLMTDATMSKWVVLERAYSVCQTTQTLACSMSGWAACMGACASRTARGRSAKGMMY
jgi:hypothetical protein